MEESIGVQLEQAAARVLGLASGERRGGGKR